jgi:catechol 2,3-dioxygenase-like lactoylglutathione lyase family enzyme
MLICPDIRVRDLERSVRFYRELGLRPAARTRMSDGTEVVWLRDPRTHQLLEVFQLSRSSPLFVPFGKRSRVENAILFSLNDLRSVWSRLRRLGAKRVTEFEDRGVRLTFIRDPDGTLIELLSRTGPRGAHRGTAPLETLAVARPSRRSSR